MSNVEVVDINNLNDIELSFILAQIEGYTPSKQFVGALSRGEWGWVIVYPTKDHGFNLYNMADNWDFKNDFFKKHCFNLEVGILSRAIIGSAQNLYLLEDEDREKAEQIGETPSIALARAFIYEYIISKNKSVYLPGDRVGELPSFKELKEVKFTND